MEKMPSENIFYKKETHLLTGHVDAQHLVNSMFMHWDNSPQDKLEVTITVSGPEEGLVYDLGDESLKIAEERYMQLRKDMVRAGLDLIRLKKNLSNESWKNGQSNVVGMSNRKQTDNPVHKSGKGTPLSSKPVMNTTPGITEKRTVIDEESGEVVSKTMKQYHPEGSVSGQLHHVEVNDKAMSNWDVKLLEAEREAKKAVTHARLVRAAMYLSRDGFITGAEFELNGEIYEQVNTLLVFTNTVKAQCVSENHDSFEYVTLFKADTGNVGAKLITEQEENEPEND